MDFAQEEGPRSRAESSGFILIAIIWIAGLLAVITSSLTAAVRTHLLFNRNSIFGTQASELADGLAQLTAWRLSVDEKREQKLSANGEWQSCTIDKQKAWISIQDQDGLVDLNTASPRLLNTLLNASLGASQAPSITAVVEDFKDANSVTAKGDAEPEFYANRDFGPSNSPFTSVDELDQIPGVTPPMFAKLTALTTVYSEQIGVSLDSAPDALLSALDVLRKDAATSEFSAPGSSRVVRITVAVQLSNGTRFVRKAIVTKVGQPDRPYIVNSWQSARWPSDLPEAVPSNRAVL